MLMGHLYFHKWRMTFFDLPLCSNCIFASAKKCPKVRKKCERVNIVLLWWWNWRMHYLWLLTNGKAIADFYRYRWYDSWVLDRFGGTRNIPWWSSKQFPPSHFALPSTWRLTRHYIGRRQSARLLQLSPPPRLLWWFNDPSNFFESMAHTPLPLRIKWQGR